MALYQTILAIMVSTSLLALAKVPVRAEDPLGNIAGRRRFRRMVIPWGSDSALFG